MSAQNHAGQSGNQGVIASSIMNNSFPIVIICSLFLLCNVCQASTTVVVDSVSATNSSVGTFICDEVKIRLVIKSDGTYEASTDQALAARHESGIWEAKGEDLILKCRSGGIGFSIKRLRPDREVPGRLLWIVPANSGSGGAMTYPIFHREI